MTFEQVERAIQFCLDQQAAFWASNAEIQENFKRYEARQEKLDARMEKLDARQEKLDVGHEKLKEELETLKEITRNLLTVAQMQSRRLDRLDGIGPS